MLSGREGGLAPALRLATPVIKEIGDALVHVIRWQSFPIKSLSKVINEERGQALLPNLRAFVRCF